MYTKADIQVLRDMFENDLVRLRCVRKNKKTRQLIARIEKNIKELDVEYETAKS